jgi:transmembrane sensor
VASVTLNRATVNSQIIQEAAEWFVEFNADTPDEATRRRFDQWLRLSPEHVRAYMELLPIWDDAAALPLPVDASAEALIASAKAASNVLALRGRSAAATDHNADQPIYAGAPVTRRWLAAAAMVAAVISVASVWAYLQSRTPAYVTGVGEQHSLMLTDGSTIQLDALSKLRVHYTAGERGVELLSGRAEFQVVKNSARPFVVRSGGVRVRAVGTQFDVDSRSQSVVVTVVDGRVAVTPPAGGGETSELGAGEQLVLSSGQLRKAEQPDVAAATAWAQRQLIFEAASLQEVAAEFNRYNTRRLSIESDQVGSIEISGIFSSTDPASLIRFLREQPGIRVVETEKGIQIFGN